MLGGRWHPSCRLYPCYLYGALPPGLSRKSSSLVLINGNAPFVYMLPSIHCSFSALAGRCSVGQRAKPPSPRLGEGVFPETWFPRYTPYIPPGVEGYGLPGVGHPPPGGPRPTRKSQLNFKRYSIKYHIPVIRRPASCALQGCGSKAALTYRRVHSTNGGLPHEVSATTHSILDRAGNVKRKVAPRADECPSLCCTVPCGMERAKHTQSTAR